MTKLRLFALFLIAPLSGFTWASGPIVYKCGSSYSQIPCDGATPLKMDDSRSKAQKLQSDADVAQQRQKADAMEKSRLQDEAKALADNKPPAKPTLGSSLRGSLKPKMTISVLSIEPGRPRENG